MEAIGGTEYSPERFEAYFEAGGPGAAEFAPFFARIGKMPFFVPRITSTNDLLKARMRAGEKPPAFLTTDNQTSGRGTGQRQWNDVSGKDVLFSVALQIESFPKRNLFSIATGASIVSNLREVTGLDIGIKWPNDIVIGNRKLGGILIDVVFGSIAIIGVGVNCRSKLEDIPENLRGEATSIAEELGGKTGKLHSYEFQLDRLPILVAAAGGAIHAAETAEESTLETLLDKFKILDHTPGAIRPVNIGGKIVQAECRYVDFDTGELVVRMPDGSNVRIAGASSGQEDKKLV